MTLVTNNTCNESSILVREKKSAIISLCTNFGLRLKYLVLTIVGNGKEARIMTDMELSGFDKKFKKLTELPGYCQMEKYLKI